MSAALRPTLLALLASSLIAAGCGDSDEDGGGSQTTTPAPAATTPAQTPTTSATTPTATGDAYEQCLDAAKNVPASARQRFEERCEQIPR